MSIQEIAHRLTVNLGQILSKVEFLAKERLSHYWQVNRVDELESHREVLDFFNQVHINLLCLVQEQMVVLFLVLLLLQFEVVIVDYILFVFSPDSDLLLSFGDLAITTEHLEANDQNAAINSKQDLILVLHKLHLV